MSESTPRRIEVFFYGLFMDDVLLREKGVVPNNRRLASLENYSISIRDRATLIPSFGQTVYGFVFTLSHDEVDQLYEEPSVKPYRPEAVLARLEDGTTLPALCFNLPTLDSNKDRNVAYATKLRDLATRLNLPADYVQKI